MLYQCDVIGIDCGKVKEMLGFFYYVVYSAFCDLYHVQWVPIELGLVDCAYFRNDNNGVVW
jgi:hypothetical protein